MCVCGCVCQNAKLASTACSILQTKTTHLVLFTNVFFISSRAACKNLAKNSKDSINLRVTHARRQLLQNLRLLVCRQLNATMSNVIIIKTTKCIAHSTSNNVIALQQLL